MIDSYILCKVKQDAGSQHVLFIQKLGVFDHICEASQGIC